MSEIVSKEKWLEQWGNASLDALRAGALEYGHKLKARTKAEASDEAYALYAGQLVPSATPDAPAPPAPRVFGYEARVIGHGGGSRCRGGYTLNRFWLKLSPAPSAEQLAALESDPRIAVRIAE